MPLPRTDLAIEATQLLSPRASGEIPGVAVTEDTVQGFPVTQVEITSQIVYGDLDRVFHIEENIRRLHDAEYEAEMAEERSDDKE